MSLDTLAIDIRKVNGDNGWNLLQGEDWDDPYKIPAIIALIHSEASEALEAFRKGDPVHFLEEMADVVIRSLDCVGGLTCSFEQIVLEKIEKNKKRGFRHGGKRV